MQKGALSSTNKDMIMREISGETKSFETKVIPWNKESLDEFLHSPIVFSGHEFEDGYRHRSTYMQTNVLVIDIDGTSTLTEIVDKLESLPFVPMYHISFSSNHDPNGIHKLHIVIPLSEPIISLEEHDALALWVKTYFPECDNKVRTDIARGIIRSNPKFRDQTLFGGTIPLQTKRILEEAKTKNVQTYIEANQNAVTNLKKGTPYSFSLDTIIYDENKNKASVREIMKILSSPPFSDMTTDYRKIAIFCPLCGFDTQVRSEKNVNLLKQNAFIRIGEDSLPYINCQSCGSRNQGADKKGSYFLDTREQTSFLQKEKQFFIFRDTITDSWWECSYSKLQQKQVFKPLSSRQSIEHTYWQHLKREMPDIKEFPQYEMRLAFNNPKVLDEENSFVNRYIPTKVMQNVLNADKVYQEVPPNIKRLILHICGESDFLYEKFIDWIAYIFQRRSKTYIAWIFQGVQGVGKDFFMDQILRPIFGYEHCATIDQKRLVSQFNTILEENVFLTLNEIQTDFSAGDSNLIAARIKMLITDKHIPIEGKGINIRHGLNNVNVMGFSNKFNTVHLEQGDRRFNVCPRQETKLINCDWLPELKNTKSLEPIIQKELPQFTMHLATRPITDDAALKVYNTIDKKRLILLTGSYTDQFFEHIVPGNIDWEWLQDNLNYEIKEAESLANIVERRSNLPKDDPEYHNISFLEAKALFTNIVKCGNRITSQEFNRKLAQVSLKTVKTRLKNENVLLIKQDN